MKTILFIDDDRFVTTLYKTKLECEGFSVDTAHTGTEALEKLRWNCPAVIVLDLNMPGISGVDVLKSIRAVPKLQHVPVIIFSSGYVRALVEGAAQLGIHKFFAKAQCPPKILITEIKELLAKQAALAGPGFRSSGDLPALLQMFGGAREAALQQAILLKIYKACRESLERALQKEEETAQGRLGRILENLFEDLYAHPEHITESTRKTLSAGLQKLEEIDAANSKPVLPSELALNDMLRALE